MGGRCPGVCALRDLRPKMEWRMVPEWIGPRPGRAANVNTLNAPDTQKKQGPLFPPAKQPRTSSLLASSLSGVCNPRGPNSWIDWLHWNTEHRGFGATLLDWRLASLTQPSALTRSARAGFALRRGWRMAMKLGSFHLSIWKSPNKSTPQTPSGFVRRDLWYSS